MHRMSDAEAAVGRREGEIEERLAALATALRAREEAAPSWGTALELARVADALDRALEVLGIGGER